MSGFFTFQEPGDLCYIFEAAHWIAFGRVPQFYPDEDGSEVRSSEKAYADFAEPSVDAWLWLNEFEVEALLPDVDPQEYRIAWEETLGASAEEIEERAAASIKRFEGSGVPELDAHVKELRKNADREKKLAAWLESASRPVKSMEERAQAQLFVALSEGRLRSWGFVERDEEESEFSEFELVEVPNEAWALKAIDWEKATLSAGGKSLEGIHVVFSELCSTFPEPSILPEQFSGQLFGATIVPDSPKSGHKRSVTAKRNRRGRPSKADGIMKKAVVNEYLKRRSNGDLAEKKEANIAALMEWCLEILEEEVGRSTIQRWLGEHGW